MQSILVDGLRWEFEFAGFATALRARSELAEIELEPWPYARHLAALREHLRVGADGLELDGSGYADAVLAQARVLRREGEGGQPLLRALALWWASGLIPGQRELDAGPDHAGWVDLGEDRMARVREWTWGERLSAQQSSLRAEGTAQLEFDPIGYFDALRKACVCELLDRRSGERLELDALDDLDAGATRRLLAAIVALNHTDATSDPLALLSPALAAATLRLCATLGWTLDRVLASPAVEIERLLALLDRVDTTPARHHQPGPSHRRIADHPDAVVILFDEPRGRGSS